MNDLRGELMKEGRRVVDGVDMVRCPHCLMFGGPKAGDARVPESGDVSLCMGCHGVSVFVEDRTLRRATAAEVRREAAEHPELLAGLSEYMRERVLGGGSVWSDPEERLRSGG